MFTISSFTRRYSVRAGAPSIPFTAVPPCSAPAHTCSGVSVGMLVHPFTPCTTVINKHVSKVFLSSFRARPCLIGASLVAQTIKNLPAKKETWVRFLGWEDPLGKEMATHSSILAWRIPCTEEPGGVHSMGLQRVRHNKMANTCLIGASQVAEWLRICLTMQEHGKLTFNPWVGKIPWRSKWQPTPVWKILWTEEPGS